MRPPIFLPHKDILLHNGLHGHKTGCKNEKQSEPTSTLLRPEGSADLRHRREHDLSV